MNRKPGEIIASFRVVKTGELVQWRANVMGGLYEWWENHQAVSMSPMVASIMQDNVAEGLVTVLDAPCMIYHCWHLCMCPKCEGIGGRVFDHSQGTWNDHLRYVDNGRLFTYPKAQGAK